MASLRHMSPITQNLERCVGADRCKYGDQAVAHYQLENGKLHMIGQDGRPASQGVSPAEEVENYNRSIYGGSFSGFSSSEPAPHVGKLNQELPDLLKAERYFESAELVDYYRDQLDDADNLYSYDRELHALQVSIAETEDSLGLGTVDLTESGFETAAAAYEDMALRLGWTILPESGQKAIMEGLNSAWRLHYGQTRKATGEPYIVHPMAAMGTLLDYGVEDQDILTAAALHDCVEDGGENYVRKSGETGDESPRSKARKFIHRRFGSKIGGLVDSVSNSEQVEGSSNPEEKRALYFSETRGKILKTPGAFVIKFADFVDNAGNLKGSTFADGEKRKRMARKYLPMVEVFREAFEVHTASGENPLSERGKKKFHGELARIEAELREIIQENSEG